MQYGIIMLFILAIMGGCIAYLGDKIGSRVGKRKIKIFGLRPKYSSILITIITGVCIAAMTLCVLGILSENVRVALFGIQRLQEQRDRLEAQEKELGKILQNKNRLIAESSRLLVQQDQQLESKNLALQHTQMDLQQARRVRDEKTKQLFIIQKALNEARLQEQRAIYDKEKAKQELVSLEKTKQRMMDTIQLLDKRIQFLNDSMIHVREGTVMYRFGEILSSSVISGGGNELQAKQRLSEAIQETNIRINKQMGIQDKNAVLVYISPTEFNGAVKALQGAGSKPLLVRVAAAGNIILGEPALVHVQLYDHIKMYRKGEVVYTYRLTPEMITGNAELQVMRILRKVNETARQRGVLPDPLTGNIGVLSAADMFKAISLLQQYQDRTIEVKVICRETTYTEGPLNISLQITPVI